MGELTICFAPSQTSRKANRHDPIAIGLLQILVQFRDVLFSDIEVCVYLVHRMDGTQAPTDVILTVLVVL